MSPLVDSTTTSSIDPVSTVVPTDSGKGVSREETAMITKCADVSQTTGATTIERKLMWYKLAVH